MLQLNRIFSAFYQVGGLKAIDKCMLKLV